MVEVVDVAVVGGKTTTPKRWSLRVPHRRLPCAVKRLLTTSTRRPPAQHHLFHLRWANGTVAAMVAEDFGVEIAAASKTLRLRCPEE